MICVQIAWFFDMQTKTICVLLFIGRNASELNKFQCFAACLIGLQFIVSMCCRRSESETDLWWKSRIEVGGD